MTSPRVIELPREWHLSNDAFIDLNRASTPELVRLSLQQVSQKAPTKP